MDRIIETASLQDDHYRVFVCGVLITVMSFLKIMFHQYIGFGFYFHQVRGVLVIIWTITFNLDVAFRSDLLHAVFINIAMIIMFIAMMIIIITAMIIVLISAILQVLLGCSRRGVRQKRRSRPQAFQTALLVGFALQETVPVSVMMRWYSINHKNVCRMPFF